jgi:hypothetical protein
LLLVVLLGSVAPASAEPIRWHVDATVSGLLPSPGPSGIVGIDIPSGTPWTADLTIDPTNICPSSSSPPPPDVGTYLGSADIFFLGYEYPGGVGLESNSAGPCAPLPGGPSLFTLVRFLCCGAPPIQLDPHGTPVIFPSGGIFGDAFDMFPPFAATLGGLPVVVPGITYDVSMLGAHFGLPPSEVGLDFSSAELTAVPEPATLAMLGTGVLGLLVRRRRRS